jgi:orotate phosphoribosyltransferase-like protein
MTQLDRILAMWNECKTQGEIAEELGISRENARVQLHRARSLGKVTMKQVPVFVDADTMQAFEIEAIARGIDTPHLFAKMARLVARDDLFSAVMDD